MRNYVIINGVNSSTKNGLAIKELPPITKPLMRTNIETIDGKDGDVITKLGYSAYDKEMEIGLYGNYDINSIISFFNQNGTIVFSNEPDKYYYFEILNQIDYQKLIKFGSATVVFHCQPFKYKLNETAINLSVGENTVANAGNIYAKPTLAITGSGTIEVSLGEVEIFNIDLGEGSSIVIDTNKLEAYNPTDNSLMNRQVIGDYDVFKLNSGNNTITLAGTITAATISNYTRWL
jgi:predicted phage tail component-like protein